MCLFYCSQPSETPLKEIAKTEKSVHLPFYARDDIPKHPNQIFYFESLTFTGDYQGVLKTHIITKEDSINYLPYKEDKQTKYARTWNRVFLWNSKGEESWYVMEFQPESYYGSGRLKRKLSLFNSHYKPDDIKSLSIGLFAGKDKCLSKLFSEKNEQKSYRITTSSYARRSVDYSFKDNTHVVYNIRNTKKKRLGLFFEKGSDYRELRKGHHYSTAVKNPFCMFGVNKFAQRTYWAAYPVLSDLIRLEFAKAEKQPDFPSELFFMNPDYRYFIKKKSWDVKDTAGRRVNVVLETLSYVKDPKNGKIYPSKISVVHTDCKSDTVTFSYQVAIGYYIDSRLKKSKT